MGVIQTQCLDDFHQVSSEYKLCSDQNGVKFGALHVTPNKIFTGDPDYHNKLSDIIQAHKVVKSSGLPNFWE